jgi:hypothetical protein
MEKDRKRIICTLSEIDIEIKKLNIKGIGTNDKHDEELYTVLKVLQTDYKVLCVTFPFIIEKFETPDIILNTNNCEIGIEITFALNQTLQKARKIRDKKNPKLDMEPSMYNIHKDWDHSEETIEQTIEKSNDKLIGPAYVDDELEKDVVNLILKSVHNKIKKFQDYQKFSKNYLVIYSDELLVDSKIIINVIKNHLSVLEIIPFDKIILRIQDKNYILFSI